MQRIFKLLLLILIPALAVMFIAGFLWFIRITNDYSQENHDYIHDNVGGIVVFTGGKSRISTALKLLRKYPDSRMLISGANVAVSKKSFQKMYADSENLFTCCIDIGYEALNTIGNAKETKNWLIQHKINTVIIVTSNYHMPRSLLEIGHMDNNITKIIPYTVESPNIAVHAWWHYNTFKILLGEYVKYLTSIIIYL